MTFAGVPPCGCLLSVFVMGGVRSISEIRRPGLSAATTSPALVIIEGVEL